MLSRLFTLQATLRNMSTLLGAFARQHSPWDASVSQSMGVINGPDAAHLPIRMRLLLDDGQWLESELALPLWMSAHEVRTEVVLHAQSLHDDAAVYVDSMAKPWGQDGMHLLSVWSAEQEVVHAVWQNCQAQYGNGDSSRPWQLVGLAPHNQQHTPLNMLAHREQAAAHYSRGSWQLLGFNVAAFAVVVAVLVYPFSASVQTMPLPLPVVEQTAEVFDLPSLTELRERLAQVKLAKHQQAVQAHQQAWQLEVFAALARDMTAHVTVDQLTARADLIEVHGHARAFTDLTGFVQALRARWDYAAHVQLRNTQQLESGVLVYDLLIKGDTPTNLVSAP